MKSLNVKTKEIHELTSEDKNQMWILYQQYYSFCEREKFEKDLKLKSHCFVGYDHQKQVKGFCLFKYYDVDYAGETVSILYTGDTMFHPSYWGAKSLHVAFIGFCTKKMIRYPKKKIYWHLISSGCRTYMSMARSTAKYYPNFKAKTPQFEQGLINLITKQQFGEQFNEKTGLVEFNQKNEGVFKVDFAPIDEKALEIDEIKYFAKKNPEYAKGVELSCVAQIGVETFFFVVDKILKKKVKLFKGKIGLSPIKTPERKKYV